MLAAPVGAGPKSMAAVTEPYGRRGQCRQIDAQLNGLARILRLRGGSRWHRSVRHAQQRCYANVEASAQHGIPLW